MEQTAIPATQRLHLEDTFLFRFQGCVLACRSPDTGRLEVALDRTAFYVDSGGQPSDRGVLAGRTLTGLRLEVDVVWHALGEPVGGEAPPDPHPGDEIAGEVDSALRLDHMQQHTGQHILSQAFLRAGDLATVSFHLGREESTIDLSGACPTPEQLAAAQEEANGCVLADLPVRIHAVERSELSRYPLRKDPGAERETLRVIEIEGFDWSACGGTHAVRTGQVGPVHILGVEKSKSFWRIRFLAGKRALRYLSAAHRALDEVARASSIRWDQIPETARTWRAELAAATKELRRLRGLLGQREGERLFHETEADADGVRRLGRWFGPQAPEELRALVSHFVSLGPALVLAGGREGDRAFWMAARSESVPAALSAWDAREALRSWLSKWGGKGGGGVLFAEGASALPAASEEETLSSRLGDHLTRIGEGPVRT